MESRIPLKPVLGDMRIVAPNPLVLMNRLNKTESDVFLYCRFSLFLKDPFFQIIYLHPYFVYTSSKDSGVYVRACVCACAYVHACVCGPCL